MSVPENFTDPFTQALDNFVQSYIDRSSKDNMGLVTYFDSDWLSPCVLDHDNKPMLASALNVPSDGSEVAWRPYLREQQTLANLEQALEIKIPSQLQQLFCRYYSHDLNASTEQGKLTILQAWNEEDFDRLQKNLIAHVLMKRRLKQHDTLFFALTDEDDFILSVMVSTGAVMLEKVGKPAEREIAPDLLTFFNQLSPEPECVSL